MGASRADRVPLRRAIAAGCLKQPCASPCPARWWEPETGTAMLHPEGFNQRSDLVLGQQKKFQSLPPGVGGVVQMEVERGEGRGEVGRG